MLIALEGADGAGKSTFAKSLQAHLERLDWQVEMRHCGPPRGEPLVEYEKELDDYYPQLQPGRAIIYDRHAWGELVYGPLLRGESRLDAAQLLHIEMYLRSRGAILVIFTQDLIILRRRLAERGDDLVKASHLPQILGSYHWLSQRMTMEFIQLRDPGEKEVAGVTFRAHRAADEVGWLHEFPAYVGSPRPKVLLVGDEPGATIARVGSPHAACFVPYREACGHYLMRALQLQPRPDAVGLINSKDTDVVRAWLGLGRPKVVALGQKAHERLSAAFLDHATVPHPQWARRFKSKDVTTYAALIQDAAKRGRGDLTKWPK